MATIAQRLSTNVPGDFFVDRSCIDCGTCRWMAPEVFDRLGGSSRVHAQPGSPEALAAALRAQVACPTASIGHSADHPMGPVVRAFPVPIEAGSPVSHCGFHAEDSFGAASWLVHRADGNVLVDSPRFNRPLVKRLEELGGVSLMVLTHRDDVADHERFAAHFGCPRVIALGDRHRGLQAVEIVVEEEQELRPGLRVIPVPGHTQGSICLQVDGTFLFTGDHLCWDLDRERLRAFRGACWYDWRTQIRSMETLVGRGFSWVLPGHGAPVRLPVAEVDGQLARLIAWMEEVA